MVVAWHGRAEETHGMIHSESAITSWSPHVVHFRTHCRHCPVVYKTVIYAETPIEFTP